MGRRLTEVALRILLPFLTVAGIVYSATGGEPANVLLWAILLTWASLTAGALLISYRYDMYQRVLPTIAAALVILSLNLSVAATDWPLRASYAVSRGSLEAVAQRVRSGEQVTTPLRAGFFTVRRAEISRHGIVCLWTTPAPAGDTGFVQCPSDRVPFNLYAMVSLDDRWQFISED